MTSKKIAVLLQKCLHESLDREWFDDDIQPSMRKKYNTDLLAAKIETLIFVLENLEDE